MNLIQIPSHLTDHAWLDGANSLVEACTDECTIDQHKLVISRGERPLVRMDDEGTVGWGVYRVDQLPNMRVFHVTNLVGHHSRFERFYDELKLMARSLGCSRIRCCAKPAQERLYKMKLNMTSIYTTLEAEI